MILSQLRSGTADLHASLEAALPLGTKDLALPRYAAILRGFYGYFAAWERTARHAAPPGLLPLIEERSRAALLTQDLAALGDAEVPLPSALPQVPDLSTTAALLGSMYVLEGSRLGGQSMVRGLELQLGLTPQHGLAFFYGFGPRTGSQWKAFCTVVEQQVSPQDTPQAVDAARSTFLSLHCWMHAQGLAGSAATAAGGPAQ